MSLYEIVARRIDGGERDLSEYRGKELLVVNVASRCGFTPQYAGLQALHRKYGDRGLAVLGFPCNQFGGQEPGTEEQIATFCETSYGVTFPMFAKVDVNGRDAHPLFAWLREEKGGLLGDRIKWNFTKFLVGRDGRVIRRYAPQAAPADLAGDIEAALAAGVDSGFAEAPDAGSESTPDA